MYFCFFSQSVWLHVLHFFLAHQSSVKPTQLHLTSTESALQIKFDWLRQFDKKSTDNGIAMARPADRFCQTHVRQTDEQQKSDFLREVTADWWRGQRRIVTSPLLNYWPSPCSAVTQPLPTHEHGHGQSAVRSVQVEVTFQNLFHWRNLVSQQRRLQAEDERWGQVMELEQLHN